MAKREDPSSLKPMRTQKPHQSPAEKDQYQISSLKPTSRCKRNLTKGHNYYLRATTNRQRSFRTPKHKLFKSMGPGLELRTRRSIGLSSLTLPYTLKNWTQKLQFSKTRGIACSAIMKKMRHSYTLP